MYLKEIEIQGFKSFADKTKVVFDQGVTAVVGPNGSGKSNITESLRWALGESSVKSLRGGKMPDVIFAGTESRKPLNYASVVVTLDNNDGFIKDAGQEIRVERHIYRSGDSEYRLTARKFVCVIFMIFSWIQVWAEIPSLLFPKGRLKRFLILSLRNGELFLKKLQEF